MTFPGFPGEWSPCGGRNGRGVGKTGVVGQEIRCRRQTTTSVSEMGGLDNSKVTNCIPVGWTTPK